MSVAEQVARAERRALQIEHDAAHSGAILATAPDAIIGVDARGMVLTANPATTSVFGVQPDEAIGQPLAALLPGLTPQGMAEAIRNGIWLHTGQCFVARQQIEGVRVGGVKFPVEVSIGQVPGEGPVRYSCIVRDITETKLAEESFNLFNRALECSHNAVLITDASMQSRPIVFVNAAFTRMTGYEPMDVLGRSPNFLAGDDAEQAGIRSLLDALESAGEATVKLRAYRRDGERFHAQISVSPMRDGSGRVTHFIGIMIDETARVQAERAVAERSARLDAIFGLSPDGFALFDSADRLVFVNPALEALTGRQWLSGEDGITLHTFDALLRVLCDAQQPYPTVAEQEASGQQRARLYLVNPVHRVVEREVRRSTHHGDAGSDGTRETILYLRDITRETEVDRMKSEFLSTAAHELRTPLASIFGFTELMLRRKYPDERQKEMLGTMHRQAALLVKLINELLDLARIEARQGKDFRLARQDLSALVEAGAQAVMPPERFEPVRLSLLPGLAVMADPDKLQQALTNLLSNAYKYSPQGGQVSLSTARRERDGHAVAVIEVRDQGMGMTPEQLKRAFERFYRADPSGNIPGTGLGLCLVKEIIELHGGQIELESTPGQGTCARLLLPLAG